MTTRKRRGPALLILAVALAACAGSPEGEPEAPTAAIEVVNGILPTTALTVHLLNGTDRSELGTVVPSGRRTFRYSSQRLASGSFRLVAETGSGREITSPAFALEADRRVVWDVEANTVEAR